MLRKSANPNYTFCTASIEAIMSNQIVDKMGSIVKFINDW